MASSDGPPSLISDSLDGLRASELQPMDTDFAEGLRKDFEKLNLKTNEEVKKSWEHIEMYTRVAGKKLTVLEERMMKDIWWPVLQIILMAVGIYSVLLGLFWYFVGY